MFQHVRIASFPGFPLCVWKAWVRGYFRVHCMNYSECSLKQLEIATERTDSHRDTHLDGFLVQHLLFQLLQGLGGEGSHAKEGLWQTEKAVDDFPHSTSSTYHTASQLILTTDLCIYVPYSITPTDHKSTSTYNTVSPLLTTDPLLLTIQYHPYWPQIHFGIIGLTQQNLWSLQGYNNTILTSKQNWSMFRFVEVSCVIYTSTLSLRHSKIPSIASYPIKTYTDCPYFFITHWLPIFHKSLGR